MSNIAVVIGADVADFMRGMSDAEKKVNTFGGVLRANANQLAGYAAAATAAGAALLSGLYVVAADTIDRQAKLARTLNSTVASIQGLEYAADLAGISSEAMAEASGKLNRKLGEAITVGGAAAIELDRLGLSAKTLANMDAAERMATLADRLQTLQYGSAQTAAALKEMGLKGNEMVAMMMEGGQQFRDANQALRDFNVLVSDVDASKIEAANDAWTTVKTALKGVANTLAVELSPYVQVVADYLRQAAAASGGFKDQIHAAVQGALTGFAKVVDVLQGLRVVFKGLTLVASVWFAGVMSLVDGIASAVTDLMSVFVSGVNRALDASNRLLGTAYEFLALPNNSDFMTGLHDAAEAARHQVGVVSDELAALAMQPMPSAQVDQFLQDVKTKADAAATAVVNSRQKMVQMPDENEDDKKKHQKSDGIMQGLHAGTEALRAELQKRQEIAQLYRDNQLSLDAPYYAQQLNDIKTSEAVKQAEILAAAQKEAAQRAEQQAQNLERVAGDKVAMAAIIAEYDLQEVLAEQIKQSGITAAQEEAQAARARLRKLEVDNAINVALGLGQQLMALTQGHSKRAFEIAKKAAIASAVVQGAQAAVAAWNSGMSVGGPWAPLIAVGYTAASLMKTGSMINSIKSSSYSGGSSPASGGGGGGSAMPNSGGGGSASAGANTGATMRVEGLDPNSLFTGSAVKTIASGLLQYQKDGGKVVFNA